MKTASRFRRSWQTPVTLLALSALAKRYKNLGMDLAKLKVTFYYLQGVKKVREFLLYLFQVFFSAFLLVVGLVLLEVGLIVYLPVTSIQRLWIILGIGAIDLALALGMLFYLFSGKKWLQDALKGNKLIDKWFQDLA